jgi:hypothetical protein
MAIYTRGGGRFASLPRATIYSPFRAENRLTVGFQAPTVSRKKDMRHTHPIWERGAESGVSENVMFLGLL